MSRACAGPSHQTGRTESARIVRCQSSRMSRTRNTARISPRREAGVGLPPGAGAGGEGRFIPGSVGPRRSQAGRLPRGQAPPARRALRGAAMAWPTSPSRAGEDLIFLHCSGCRGGFRCMSPGDQVITGDPAWNLCRAEARAQGPAGRALQEQDRGQEKMLETHSLVYRKHVRRAGQSMAPGTFLCAGTFLYAGSLHLSVCSVDPDPPGPRHPSRRPGSCSSRAQTAWLVPDSYQSALSLTR
jgi:hypothetical protein